MTVSAFTNIYTNTSVKTEPFVVTTTAPNGTWSQSATTGAVALVIRQNKSSNPVIIVKGVPTRKASNYRRVCTRVSYEPGNVRYKNGNIITGVRRPLASGEIDDVGTALGSTGISAGFGGTSGFSLNNMNRARTQCLLKLNEQKVSLGTFLAETKRAANQLAVLTSDFARHLIALKRRNWRYFRAEYGDIRNIPNGYLAWKYGFAPLARDIYSMAEIVREGLGSRAQILYASSTVSNSDQMKTNEFGYQFSGQIHLKNTCSIMAKLNEAFIANAQSVGLVNPVELGWELVPYSFAVDWVLPVGNFLQALTASAGLDFLTGYDGQRMEGFLNGFQSPLPGGYTGIGDYCEGNFFEYRRSRLTSFPTPVPYVKSPFTTGNISSALALLSQLSRR